MALDLHGTKFFLYAREIGVSFADTAMLGRQTMIITSTTLQKNFKEFGFQISLEEAENMLKSGFAEPFLKKIGANNIVSFDASDFENPTVVHDFNQPISDEYKNKFSVVIDGGTLEHIFNFPTAIRNCLEMIKEGGHFIGLSPANNYMGHGFYQFSPELYYRIFTARNGFKVKKILIYEERNDSHWYEVSDPEEIKDRVILINDQPSLMLIIAEKTKTCEIFREFPMQSDYVVRWEENLGDGEIVKDKVNNSSKNHESLLIRIPRSLLNRTLIRVNRQFGMLKRQNKKFKKFTPPE